MNESIVIYWVQFFKILYCIGIVLYWPNTFKNCIVYCIVKENAKSPGLDHHDGRTNGPTDQRMDGQSLLQSCVSATKKKEEIVEKVIEKGNESFSP